MYEIITNYLFEARLFGVEKKIRFDLGFGLFANNFFENLLKSIDSCTKNGWL